MQITDGAKEIISSALTEQQCDGIRLRTQKSCCGKSLEFELINLKTEEKPEQINGLLILMDDETRQWTGTVTIDTDGKKLTLNDSASCCS